MRRTCELLIGMLIIAIMPLQGKDLRMNQSHLISTKQSSGIPFSQIRVHKPGNVHLTVTNYGQYGTANQPFIDPETNLLAPSCEYPEGSQIEYLFMGGLWIGAIVGNDTLVSVGTDGWQAVNEMFPDSYPDGDIDKRSDIPSDGAFDPMAISDADYIAVYYDTLTDPTYVHSDPYDGRPHLPLGLKITQESYSWSFPQYEDFVIFKYHIRNIGQNNLKQVYFGLYFDTDILHRSDYSGYSDDITGFHLEYDSQTQEEIPIAWAADNDGGPYQGAWDYRSQRGVFGVTLLHFATAPELGYNWWRTDFNAANDWGPRRTSSTCDFITGGAGTPAGDISKYCMMAEEEIDYDQLWAKIDLTAQGWRLPHPIIGGSIATGFDTKFLLSFGGADLNPGDSLEFAFAVIMGENFHQQPSDFSNLFNPDGPEPYYNALDFSDLLANVRAARNLYRQLGQYLCGDANNDGLVNIADAVWIINYIFAGGGAPYQYKSGDVNCDDKINLVDIVYIINYIFRGGTPPCDLDNDGVPNC